MSGKQLSVAVFLIGILLSTTAIAQDEKNEIGGAIGRTFISDQGIQGATYFDLRLFMLAKGIIRGRIRAAFYSYADLLRYR